MSSFQAQFLSLTQTLSVASEKSVRWADQAGRRKMSKLSSSFRRQPKSEDKPLRRFRLDMEKGAEPVSTLVTTKVTKVTTATVGSAHTGTVVTTQTPQPVELPQAPIVIPKNPYKKSKPSEPVKSIVKAPSKAKARKSKGKSQSPSHLKTKKKRNVLTSSEPVTPIGMKSSLFPYSKATFHGIENHVLNAAANPESLSEFLTICASSSAVAFTAIFSDDYFSTAFVPVTAKFCTPKGDRCTRWWCTCNKQSRSSLARIQVAAYLFTCETGGKLSTFMVPIDPDLPFECSATLEDRWDAIRKVILSSDVPDLDPRKPKAVTFSTIRSILPLHSYFSGGAGRQRQLISQSIFDIQLASFLVVPNTAVDEGTYEFDEIWEHFGGVDERKEKTGLPLDASDEMRSLDEAIDNLRLCLALRSTLSLKLKEQNLEDSFYQLESPIAFLLASIECSGIGFLPTRLTNMETRLDEKIGSIAAIVQGFSSDPDFNIRSPRQIAKLLFTDLNIPKPASNPYTSQKKKTDQISTGVEVLLSVKGAHEVVPLLLEYRKLNKVKTTYISSLTSFCVGGAGDMTKIYPVWHTLRTRTGRLSCSKPNMQNIPNKAIFEGVHPRDAFVAGKSETLFSVDYRQIEIRILAHFTQDHALMKLFRDSENDIYKSMSMRITGKKSISDVTGNERAIAKQVVLAVVYGMGAPQVAKKLGVEISAAATFFNNFFAGFPGVRRWMQSVKRFAVNNGYILTITGRRRWLPDIRSENREKSARAGRQAVNSVIQGSSADLVKLAMIKVASNLEMWNNSGEKAPELLLQIHDELVFSLPETRVHVERLKKLVERCLCLEVVRDLRIQVALLVTCKVGKSFGDAMVDYIE